MGFVDRNGEDEVCGGAATVKIPGKFCSAEVDDISRFPEIDHRRGRFRRLSTRSILAILFLSDDLKTERRYLETCCTMNGSRLWSSQLGRAPGCAWRNTATTRRFTAGGQWRQDTNPSADKAETGKNKEDSTKEEEQEQGALSRRLSQMTEDAMLEGGRSARRNIENAGFSEDLKRQLEERVLAASFKSEHAAAHSILDMPVRI